MPFFIKTRFSYFASVGLACIARGEGEGGGGREWSDVRVGELREVNRP